MTEELNTDSITFGKYKGKQLADILKDRNYSKWLVKQDWFEKNYEYLYNRVKEYNPLVYFIKSGYEGECKEDCKEKCKEDFMKNYKYFNLIPPEDITISLTDEEKICHNYYYTMVKELKEKIIIKTINNDENPYNIKAPTSWLKKFEKTYDIKRRVFKEFLVSYELPNIPYIVEHIKKEGGIEYKGAQSFKIAKARSEKQEKWWEDLLKSKYGEDLGTQFKYENCIFDFLNISTNTIFECKLGLKDFDESQHIKYKLTLEKYRIIYLISRDCVIDMERKGIYTTNPVKYEHYINNICNISNSSYLDVIIEDFSVNKVEDLSTLFGVRKEEINK